MYKKYIDSDGQELTVKIYINGDKAYRNYNNHYHRLDGPAVEYNDGDSEWFKENKLHRIGGPALDYYSLDIFDWYINNKQVRIYYIYG